MQIHKLITWSRRHAHGHQGRGFDHEMVIFKNNGKYTKKKHSIMLNMLTSTFLTVKEILLRKKCTQLKLKKGYTYLFHTINLA